MLITLQYCHTDEILLGMIRESSVCLCLTPSYVVLSMCILLYICSLSKWDKTLLIKQMKRAPAAEDCILLLFTSLIEDEFIHRFDLMMRK